MKASRPAPTDSACRQRRSRSEAICSRIGGGAQQGPSSYGSARARFVQYSLGMKDKALLRRMIAVATRRGGSLVLAARLVRKVSEEDSAARTGMPVARFRGEVKADITFTPDELDQIAAVLDVPVDLLMD